MYFQSLTACVYEATGNVDVPFYMGSPLQLLAAIIIFCYRLVVFSHLKHQHETKGPPFCETTLSDTFSWQKIVLFPFRFHWSLFCVERIHNKSELIQIMAWRQTGDKTSPEKMMTKFYDAIWHHYTTVGHGIYVFQLTKTSQTNKILPYRFSRVNI